MYNYQPPNLYEVILELIIIMCYFSKLEHIAHHKEQNTIKTNFYEHARAHTHTHTHRVLKLKR